MGLVIKKLVDLSTLGKEYEGIEVVFKSIPAKDLPGIDEQNQGLKKDEKGNPVISEAMAFFIEILEKYFVSGSQDDVKLTKEDVKELDSKALIYCFQIMSGQIIDPKEEISSTATSTTEPNNP